MERRLIVADGVRMPSGNVGTAVLVSGGKIEMVGSAEALGGTVVEDRYPGCTIVPGLRDVHLHPIGYAAVIGGMSLDGISSLDALGEHLSAMDARLPNRAPLLAMRLDDESLVERRLPTRQDLDAAVPDRPVLIHRYCGHIAIANTAALAMTGIDRRTPDPPGGLLDRAPDGEPTGVLRETAIDLVSAHLTDVAAVDADSLLGATYRLAGLGLTSVGAMLRPGDGPWAGLGNEVDMMCEIGRELPIKVHALVITTDPEQLAEAANALGNAGSRLSWLGLKLFADGSLGGHTASMVEPYADEPSQRGKLRTSPGDEKLARTALDLGGMVAIHAIGDRACSEVIDLFERLIGDGVEPKRLRIEHASVLAAADINRLASLGVHISVQPSFLGSETEWLERRVGAERLARTYPFATLHALGTALAGGSDAPVESPDPLAGIALARDRAGIVPDEGLSAEAALGMFTVGAAAALREPFPLDAGSPADFVVLDRDPVLATPDELRETRVVDTWVDGAPVSVDRSIPTWVS